MLQIVLMLEDIIMKIDYIALFMLMVINLNQPVL